MTSQLKNISFLYLQVFVRNFCSRRGVSRYAIDLAYQKYKCEKAGGRLKSDFQMPMFLKSKTSSYLPTITFFYYRDFHS
jgi:hypothetical protein